MNSVKCEKVEGALADFEGRASLGWIGRIGKGRRAALKKAAGALAEVLVSGEEIYPFECAYLSVIGNVELVGADRVSAVLEKLTREWKSSGDLFKGFGPSWAPKEKYVGVYVNVLKMHGAKRSLRESFYGYAMAKAINKNPEIWLGDERLGLATFDMLGADQLYIVLGWDLERLVRWSHPEVFGVMINQLVNTDLGLEVSVDAALLDLMDAANGKQIQAVHKKNWARLLASKDKLARERAIRAIGKAKLGNSCF